MDLYPIGFEEEEHLRSAFIRDLTLLQLGCTDHSDTGRTESPLRIPRRLVRYWHAPHDLPEDVRACLSSWDRLADEGFEFRMFDDRSAAAYIADRYGVRECEAFSRCRHPEIGRASCRERV